jgi:hypothetical protein
MCVRSIIPREIGRPRKDGGPPAGRLLQRQTSFALSTVEPPD